MATGVYALLFADQPPGCTSTQTPKRFYVKVGEIGMTTEGARQIYAATLTALATDMPLFVVFDNATSDCYISRVQISKD